MIQFSIPMNHCQYSIDSGSKNRDIPLPPSTVPNARGGTSLGGGVIRREPVGRADADVHARRAFYEFLATRKFNPAPNS